MKTNQIFTAFIVIFLFQASTVNCFAQQPPKTAEQLFLKWINWGQELQEMSPVHLVLSQSNPDLDGWGCKSEKVECHQYADSEKLKAVEVERETTGTGELTISRFFVGIYRSDLDSDSHYTVLERKAARDQWVVSEVANLDESQSYLYSKFIYEMPAFKKNQSFSEQYRAERLETKESGNDVRIIRFTPVSSKANLSGMTPMEYVVRFEEKVDWLPTIINTKFLFATSEVATWSTVLSDWKKVGSDILVPYKKVTEAILDSGEKLKVDSVDFSVIEYCSKSDVLKRCSLSYYSLPDLPVDGSDGSSSKVVFWGAITVVILVGLFLFFRKKKSSL